MPTGVRSSRHVTVLVLAALLFGLLVPVAPPAATAAAPMFGHDISWPQCSVAAGGYGLPMPPSSTEFVIIGLTKGLPFTENPCLASQHAWVTSRSKPAHAYTIPAYPTAAQLTKYKAAGPWSSATPAGRLSNVGYAEATFAMSTLKKVGWAPPVVWIDVEPRPAQPWPSSTTTQRLRNRYVVEGMMRGFRDAGIAYGLYSYTNGWKEIVGSWRLPGVPVWATAGRLDYPNEALDRCSQPSFSGGRVLISQWYDDTRDYDRTCGSYAFTALRVPPSSLSNSTNEFNGDWNNDVLARVAASGDLRLYAGDGRGKLRAPVRIGTGWQVMDLFDTAGDLNGDGALDVIAREKATGYLWLYPGNGRGAFKARVRIGTGWGVMNAVFGAGDFNGDGRDDVIARQKSNGWLWLYPGNGKGGFSPRVRIGTSSGWNGMNALVGAGDLNGDGKADVIARQKSNGWLWLYPGNGKGGFSSRVRIGTSSGWNGMNALVGPGDLNGDRHADLLARNAKTGELWLYPGNGKGGFGTRVKVGTTWKSLDSLR
jgi:hypothetical protein